MLLTRWLIHVLAEFEAATPYYYSVYGGENEVSRNKPSRRRFLYLVQVLSELVRVLNSTICSVHCTWAFKEEGYETIIVNNNPETVSQQTLI